MSKHPIYLLALTLAPCMFFACAKTAEKANTRQDTVQITNTTVPTTIHGGDTLTLYGKNLPSDLSAYSVTLNKMAFRVISAGSDSIRAVVPKMAGSGYVTLQVNTSTYQGPYMNYDYVVTVTTIAGNGSQGTNNGAALGASFYCPWGITADGNGDLYIADCYNRLLRKYTAATSTVSQIDIPDTFSFYSPYNIALDRLTHNLYFTDFNLHLAKYNPGGSFTLLYNDSMPNTGIAVGPDGWLYMSNNTFGTVIRLDTNGNNRTLFGSGITTPRNLIFDKSGNLYVAAYGVYMITPSDVQSELFMDNVFGGWEIARDTLGNIYEADHFNNNLRMVEASTGNIITIAGSGNAADVDGTGLNASFNGPQGLCIDDLGNLYTTTFNYNTNGGNEIRKITIQ